MAMVNVNNLLNIKDSRWLQLEVCREFQRNKCSRPDTECKFAHPPANVEVQNGRVTACYDSIKGRCNREKPPCKYFHPPAHLKDQLLINGRNHLALKNALMQQMGLAPGQPVVPGQVPGVQATNPYLTGVTSQYNPYFATGPLVSLVSDPSGAVMSPMGVPQQTVVQQKLQRADRLERRLFIGSPYPPPPPMLEIMNGRPRNMFRGFGFNRLDEKDIWTTYPGMVTYKRPAGDKSVTLYQPANTPSAAAYQHLMQLQQPFVPVSSNSIQHNIPASSSGPSATAGLSVNLGQDHSGLMNGTLDSNLDNESSVTKVKNENEDNSNENLDNGNVGGGKVALNSNDLEDESKESAIKRMRVNNVGNTSQVNLNSNVSSVSASAAMAQNNAAYVAAAQSYHNALAAMNYTGVSLQANKAPQAIPQPQVQPSHSYSQQIIPQGAHPSYQSQQNQQQQLISQYQAMAAAFAGQQGAGYPQPQHLAASQVGVQQQQPNLNFNPVSAAGFNQIAAAAMNPYLAASLPQLAAAQRASLLTNHQQAGNPMAGGAYANPNPYGVQQTQAASPAFNPFGMQFGAPGGAAAAGLQFQQQQHQQQQALLAAYGQFARGPVPVAVSAASGVIPPQQLYMGNPAVAAAAAAAAAANGPLQPGVKRMRPA